MEDSKNPLPVVDKNNHLSKPNFYLFVLQMKSSSTCLITASLREGPFFYFYVESPSSIFMHRLREHSCHSEYNVHCPKVFIDWFMILVSPVLKLFVSSRLLKLEGVLCIYVLLSHEGQAENHLYVFPYDLNTRLTFIVSFSWSFVCVLFHVITWLLSFFYQDYNFHAYVLSSFDPSAQRLHIWSRLCRCMSPQKIISFVITYLLEDEQELSLGMLIHLKRIYNFWWSMLVFTPFP
jgi:hypothetical protein